MKLLLDEHVTDAFRVQFRERAPEIPIWRVGQPAAPSISTPDPQLLRWCEQHEFLLFTNNRKTMPRHLADHLAAGGHVPGIIMPKAGAAFGEILDDLVLITVAGRPDEFRDTVTYVPLRW
jgi:hypothetical protein